MTLKERTTPRTIIAYIPSFRRPGWKHHRRRSRWSQQHSVYAEQGDREVQHGGIGSWHIAICEGNRFSFRRCTISWSASSGPGTSGARRSGGRQDLPCSHIKMSVSSLKVRSYSDIITMVFMTTASEKASARIGFSGATSFPVSTDIISVNRRKNNPGSLKLFHAGRNKYGEKCRKYYLSSHRFWGLFI